MKKSKTVGKKIVSFLTMLAMVTPLFIVGTVNVKANDIEGNWAKTEINKWVLMGIIKGYPDGSFKPEASITRAEFVTIVNGAFNFIEKSDNVFDDVQPNAWYADGISKAVHAGILAGDGTGNVNPDATITREASAAILQRVFELQVQNQQAADKFSDAYRISSWAKDSVSAMTENGFLFGRPGNIIAPLDRITRAEAIKMIDNITGTLKNIAGTYTGTIEGNLVVNTKNVVLKDMTIKGNLYLTQGIGEGDIILDGVTVEGKTYVNGGGEDTITIKDSSLQGTLVVLKANGKIKLVATGSTEIGLLQLKSGAIIEEKDLTGKGFMDIEVVGTLPSSQKITLSGDFENVTIKVPNATVELIAGTIKNLVVSENAEGAEVKVNSQVTVKNFVADASVTLTGTGIIEKATVNAEGVSFEQKPLTLIVAEGITVEIAGSTIKDGTTTTPTTGGSSSSDVSVDKTQLTLDISVSNSVYGVGGNTVFNTVYGEVYQEVNGETSPYTVVSSREALYNAIQNANIVIQNVNSTSQDVTNTNLYLINALKALSQQDITVANAVYNVVDNESNTPNEIIALNLFRVAIDNAQNVNQNAASTTSNRAVAVQKLSDAVIEFKNFILQ